MTTVMNESAHLDLIKAKLSDHDFSRLSAFIYGECGIKMPPVKKVMLESRLHKRLRALGLRTYREYCDYLFSPEGMQNELVHMIDVVTTNKTDFFREPKHFQYLTSVVLPELMNQKGADSNRTLMVWSAGCSTGEEPYTLAMVLSGFADQCYGGLDFLILATDISTKVLEKAKDAVYGHETVAPVPVELRKKYLLRGRDRSKNLVRIIPGLREKVKFRRLNFLDGDFGMREPMDIIFCRNVLIYFDRPTQEKILNKFCRHLSPGGYVFLGHSETLHSINVPLVSVSTTIYRKPA